MTLWLKIDDMQLFHYSHELKSFLRNFEKNQSHTNLKVNVVNYIGERGIPYLTTLLNL